MVGSGEAEEKLFAVQQPHSGGKKVTEIKQGFVFTQLRIFSAKSFQLDANSLMIFDHDYYTYLIISEEGLCTGLVQATEIDGLIMGPVGVLESSDFYFFSYFAEQPAPSPKQRFRH